MWRKDTDFFRMKQTKSYLVLSNAQQCEKRKYLCALFLNQASFMKLPSKYIALVVVASLTAIFAYQAYWLVNLYQTQCQTAEHDIIESMRLSDYNEIILRVEHLEQDSICHGEVSVSAGYNDSVPYVESRTITTTDTSSGTLSSVTQPQMRRDTALLQPSFHTNDVNFLFGRKNTMAELAGYFQRGLHAGLDVLHEPDFAVYDSLLGDELRRAGLSIPYRLIHLHRGETYDSAYVFTDTLGIRSTAGYLPSSRAKTYEYSYDLHGHWLYRLTTEPLGGIALRQMAGILATSALIFATLGFSFWFLIRILLRQRSLEEMKDDFTNNITHELKTPIAVAYAANDALLNFGADTDEAKRDRYLRICQEQLKRLSGLVEQILSLSMERRRTFRLHLTTFAPGEVIVPLVEEHKLKADKPVDIDLRITPPELTVSADRTHFANIVSNLLDNAIKYSRERAEVTVSCRTEGGDFVLAVRDRGIGIPKERLVHVFDKFYRVPTGNRHEVKGYGLGVFYVKTMVEKHGGTVEVDSEPGQGSEFIVRLNMKHDEA